MKGSGRILIAGDCTSEAEEIQRLLADHFKDLRVSIRSERAASDFDEYAPAVIVLAFHQLEQAQRYYLGVHRFAKTLRDRQHGTVLLCDKHDVPAAFDLCKNNYFDDYVLYWPVVQDGLRLPMSVWNACRAVVRYNSGPRRSDLLAHARNLRNLDVTLQEGVTTAEQQIDLVGDTLLQLEREIANASDELSSRVSRERSGVDPDCVDPLIHSLQTLRNEQIQRARSARRRAVEPLARWARQFKESLRPSLRDTRVLMESVQQLRPVVLVIDQDESVHQTIGHMLDAGQYRLEFAADNVQAAKVLSNVHPDAILMDVVFEGVDGVSFMQRLKSIPKLLSVPVIVISADARLQILKASLDAGACDFLAKPFTRDTLISKLTGALGFG